MHPHFRVMIKLIMHGCLSVYLVRLWPCFNFYRHQPFPPPPLAHVNHVYNWIHALSFKQTSILSKELHLRLINLALSKCQLIFSEFLDVVMPTNFSLSSLSLDPLIPLTRRPRHSPSTLQFVAQIWYRILFKRKTWWIPQLLIIHLHRCMS